MPASAGIEVEIPKLARSGDCALNSNEGGYFDSPANPTKIEVCAGTCSQFRAGAVDALIVARRAGW